MTTMTVLQHLAQDGLGTGGIRQWIIDHIIPLVLLLGALLIFFRGKSKGDMSAVGQLVIVILVMLGILGFATGALDPIKVGTTIATMFSG